MLGIETLFPARAFPPIPYWRLKGFCFLTVQGLLATLTPLVIPEHWLAAHRLMNLESLGVIGGAVLGYAVVSLASYGWHRSAHTFPLMWRLFYQDHPTPQPGGISGAGPVSSPGTGGILGDPNTLRGAGPRGKKGPAPPPLGGRAGTIQGVAAGVAEVGGYPGALGADGALGDLHDDFRSDREPLLDFRGEVLATALLTAAAALAATAAAA